VWETWKADWELMGLGGSTAPTPSEWSDWATPGLTPCPNVTVPAGTKILTTQGKQIRGLNQAFSGPLVDQQRNYARYEVRIGQNEYTTIRQNQWFVAANVPATLELGQSVDGTYGAIELKAAWRELEEGADASRFYTVRALKRDPGTSDCVSTRVALVGFHIAHKTQPFREWVWSTFEHVDNVPTNPPGTPQQGVTHSFNNGTTTPPSAPGFDHTPDQLSLSAPLPPKTDPKRNPVQVTRFEPTPAEVAAANDAFRAADPVKGTVWANYVLVNNQWPTDPASFRPKPPGQYPNDAGRPFPALRVANTTMETYYQNLEQTDGNNSCMSCHYFASKRDFSFLFVQAWRPPSMTLTRSSMPEELRLLMDAIKETERKRR
jgi:hypothetical protein